MTEPHDLPETTLGAAGRVVVPARLRRALGLKPGDRLIVRQVGDAILLEPREAIRRRLRSRFAKVPAAADLAEELIAERREESQREQSGR